MPEGYENLNTTHVFVAFHVRDGEQEYMLRTVMETDNFKNMSYAELIEDYFGWIGNNDVGDAYWISNERIAEVERVYPININEKNLLNRLGLYAESFEAEGFKYSYYKRNKAEKQWGINKDKLWETPLWNKTINLMMKYERQGLTQGDAFDKAAKETGMWGVIMKGVDRGALREAHRRFYDPNNNKYNSHMRDFDAENWGGDPEGPLAKALEKARKKSKKSKKPLKIEKLDAEDEHKWFEDDPNFEVWRCGWCGQSPEELADELWYNLATNKLYHATCMDEAYPNPNEQGLNAESFSAECEACGKPRLREDDICEDCETCLECCVREGFCAESFAAHLPCYFCSKEAQTEKGVLYYRTQLPDGKWGSVEICLPCLEDINKVKEGKWIKRTDPNNPQRFYYSKGDRLDYDAKTKKHGAYIRSGGGNWNEQQNAKGMGYDNGLGKLVKLPNHLTKDFLSNSKTPHKKEITSKRGMGFVLGGIALVLVVQQGLKK